MRIGASLLLIAVGAILKFAVTKGINGVNVGTVGVILIVVGVIGLLITLVMTTARRRTDVIHHRDGTTVVTPNDTVDGVDPRY